MDNTRIKLPVVESVTSNKIYLNNRINLEFPIVDFSSIMFIHFNKKDVKALLVSVPKDFDKSKLDYDYFRTNNCEFILKGWYYIKITPVIINDTEISIKLDIASVILVEIGIKILSGSYPLSYETIEI